MLADADAATPQGRQLEIECVGSGRSSALAHELPWPRPLGKVRKAFTHAAGCPGTLRVFGRPAVTDVRATCSMVVLMRRPQGFAYVRVSRRTLCSSHTRQRRMGPAAAEASV